MSNATSFTCAVLTMYEDAVERTLSGGSADLPFPIVGVVLLLGGLAIAAAGKAFATATLCVASGGACALSVGVAIDASGLQLSCLSVLAALGASFLAGCVAGCKLLRVALFLFGASVGMAAAYTIFLLVPALAGAALFSFSPVVLGERLVPFWSGLGVAGLAGGVLLLKRKDAFLLVATAILGGCLVALGLHLLLSNEGGISWPAQVYGAIAVAVAGTGAAVQKWRQDRGKKKGSGGGRRHCPASSTAAGATPAAAFMSR